MFKEIVIDNLRLFEHLRFEPATGMNVITGGNGAGKTTLLEGLYIASTGKSFRHRENSPLIRRGESQVQLVTRFVDAHGNPHVVGIKKDRSDQVVRLDGRGNVRRSEILRLLPVQFIGADPQHLLSGAPEARRTFIDSGLFHVEPSYLGLLQRYSRILAQRNMALRHGGLYPARLWDTQLTDLGDRISGFREDYLSDILDRLKVILGEWEISADLTFDFRRGWPRGLTFSEALERAGETDEAKGFTTAGPHRADLVVSGNVARSGKVLSRGQLKMIVIALHLAQAGVQASVQEIPPVLLLDDLAAELDRTNRARVVDAVSSVYRQWFLTALDLDDLPLSGDFPRPMVFHVEHGSLPD